MEELIEKAQKGDKEAFTQAILLIKNNLYKIAKMRTSDEESIQDNIASINSIDKIKEENLSISITNEISEYIPKNIKEITLINNMSDLTNPTTYHLTEIEQMEKFMNLFTKTHWNERQDAKYDTFDGASWEIHIVGEFECLLKMQGIGGINSQSGVVQIESRDDIKDYYISREIYMEILAFTNEKYYLHDSKLEIPSQEKCYAAQEKALEGLTEDAKKNLQKNIRLHSKIRA